jgi:hypothetical protein
VLRNKDYEDLTAPMRVTFAAITPAAITLAATPRA